MAPFNVRLRKVEINPDKRRATQCRKQPALTGRFARDRLPDRILRLIRFQPAFREAKRKHPQQLLVRFRSHHPGSPDPRLSRPCTIVLVARCCSGLVKAASDLPLDVHVRSPFQASDLWTRSARLFHLCDMTKSFGSERSLDLDLDRRQKPANPGPSRGDEKRLLLIELSSSLVFAKTDLSPRPSGCASDGSVRERRTGW